MESQVDHSRVFPGLACQALAVRVIMAVIYLATSKIPMFEARSRLRSPHLRAQLYSTPAKAELPKGARGDHQHPVVFPARRWSAGQPGIDLPSVRREHPQPQGFLASSKATVLPPWPARGPPIHSKTARRLHTSTAVFALQLWRGCCGECWLWYRESLLCQFYLTLNLSIALILLMRATSRPLPNRPCLTRSGPSLGRRPRTIPCARPVQGRPVWQRSASYATRDPQPQSTKPKIQIQNSSIQIILPFFRSPHTCLRLSASAAPGVDRRRTGDGRRRAQGWLVACHAGQADAETQTPIPTKPTRPAPTKPYLTKHKTTKPTTPDNKIPPQGRDSGKATQHRSKRYANTNILKIRDSPLATPPARFLHNTKGRSSTPRQCIPSLDGGRAFPSARKASRRLVGRDASLLHRRHLPSRSFPAVRSFVADGRNEIAEQQAAIRKIRVGIRARPGRCSIRIDSGSPPGTRQRPVRLSIPQVGAQGTKKASG